MIGPLKVFTQVYSEVSGFMNVLKYSAT